MGCLPLSRPLKNSFLTEKYANSSMNLRVNFQIHGFFSILLDGMRHQVSFRSRHCTQAASGE